MTFFRLILHTAKNDMIFVMTDLGILKLSAVAPYRFTEELCSRMRGSREAFALHFLRRKLQKEYLAVIAGKPAEDAGTLRDLLYHDRAKNKSYPVKRMRAGVKEAELDYALLESRDGLSLVRVRLHTGRSHQIRVQFASRGMPLAGDVKYGSAVRDCPIALFSCALSLPHPRTGEALSFSAAPEAIYPWQLFSTIQTEVQHEIS